MCDHQLCFFETVKIAEMLTLCEGEQRIGQEPSATLPHPTFFNIFLAACRSLCGW